MAIMGLTLDQVYINIYQALRAYARAKAPHALIADIQFTLTPGEVGIDLEDNYGVCWVAKAELKCKNDPQENFYCLQQTWVSGQKADPHEACENLANVLDAEFGQFVTKLIRDHEVALASATVAADRLRGRD